MSADLAAYTATDSSLERLTRQSVIELLERGKSWIDLAVQRDTEVNDFVEFKGQAETVRVYTVQKQLGKDAELAAAELVRRALRGIALAVRKGQAEGTVATQADAARVATNARPDVVPQENYVKPPSPKSFFGSTKEYVDAYAMADGVTDEQFDAVLAEARAEGDVSRANVVRKVTGKTAPKGKRPEVLRKTRRIDSHRVIAATVDTAAANVITPDLLAEIDMGELETHDLEEWISSLSESIRALTSLKTTLKKELSQRG